jgi:hypothetical protein
MMPSVTPTNLVVKEIVFSLESPVNCAAPAVALERLGVGPTELVNGTSPVTMAGTVAP